MTAPLHSAGGEPDHEPTPEQIAAAAEALAAAHEPLLWLAAWRARACHAKYARLTEPAKAQLERAAAWRKRASTLERHLATVDPVLAPVGMIGVIVFYVLSGGVDAATFHTLFKAYNLPAREAWALPPAVTLAVMGATSLFTRARLSAHHPDNVSALKQRIMGRLTPLFVIGLLLLNCGLALIGGEGVAQAPLLPGAEPYAATALVLGILLLQTTLSVSLAVYQYTPGAARYASAVRDARKARRRANRAARLARAAARRRAIRATLRAAAFRAEMQARQERLRGMSAVADVGGTTMHAERLIDELYQDVLDTHELLDDYLRDLDEDEEPEEDRTGH